MYEIHTMQRRVMKRLFVDVSTYSFFVNIISEILFYKNI